ncbi:hypothetical protein D9757_008854 [Collybiopsis confluens]|uniref:FAS1 domain-containing protein n=1 Tax=Collybiopsis confluens TaxID=2823264 RepID=A0A8H5H3Z5_9AGAR|nr:hypothetical protein D9757_008854 [Collybiopsis confluens]
MRLQNLAVLAAFVSVSYAQNLTAFANALQSLGATTFGSIAANLSSTPQGQTAIQTLLSGGNFTIFAPSNDALAAVPESVTSNSSALLDVVLYHVLPGSFSSSNSSTPVLMSATFPNHTLGRTLLNSTESEGNVSQVLAWTKEGNTISFLNQPTNVSVVNSTRVEGAQIDIYLINGVLTSPPTLTTLVSNSTNTTSLGGLLNNTFITGSDGSNTTLGNYLSQGTITAFAPINAAFSAIQSSLSSLATNQSGLITVLQNHLINGTALYSTEIANNTSQTSAAGETLHFSTNSSGTFVTSGSASAKIIQTDLLTSNGVVHLIDNVLVNLESDPAAASSAFASATSAAATETRAGPIAASATGPNSGSSTTSGGGSNNAAGALIMNLHSCTFSVATVISFVLGAYMI